jgi:hypothetical protein
MKIAVVLASLVMTFGVMSAFAEDAVVETPKETEAAAAAERQRKLQAEEKAKAALEKKPVTYGGFIHDVKHAENKKKFFSLRQPRDPKNDTKNISYDERTGRPRGFVLFRAEF